MITPAKLAALRKKVLEKEYEAKPFFNTSGKLKQQLRDVQFKLDHIRPDLKIFFDKSLSDNKKKILQSAKENQTRLELEKTIKNINGQLEKIQPDRDRLLIELQALNKQYGNAKRELAPYFEKKKQIVREKAEKAGEKRAENRKIHLKRERERIQIQIRSEIEINFATLERNFNNSIILDEDGAITKDTRYGEFERFLVSRKITRQDFHLPIELQKLFNNIIDEEYSNLCKEIKKKKNENKNKGFDGSSYPEDPYEFEKWVASSMEMFGWKAFVSPGSGDQGIDVLANLNGLSLGVQCKLYSGTVGNKAVQECLAGKGYYGLDHAVVMTNSTYTKSAKELAAKTKILLLGVSDIPRLYEILKGI